MSGRSPWSGLLDCSRGSEHERTEGASRLCLAVRQIWEPPVVRDELHQRGVVHHDVINPASSGEWRNDKERNPETIAPLVDLGRRYVVIEPARLIPDKEDCGPRPLRALHDRTDDL